MSHAADYRAILKRVGIALIVFGLIDIAFMIYTVSEGRSYSSSFNVFAVIAGIFLFRGSLAAARLVTRFSAFMLAAFFGAIFLLLPFLQPPGLMLIQARLDPVATLSAWLIAIVGLTLIAWTYRQLRSVAVLEALKTSGRPTSPPKVAFGLGLVLAIVLAAVLFLAFKGATGDKAVELAREKLGHDYNYAIQSFQLSGDRRSAVVAAYNDHEVKYVPVEWSE